MPGGNLASPEDVVAIDLPGPFDLSAVIVGAGGTVAGDGDLVFFGRPAGPGVVLSDGRVTVTPGGCGRGPSGWWCSRAPSGTG